MVERKYSKTTKNHQKLLTNGLKKALYLSQYTTIGKIIKRNRTVSFSYLHQWHFVLNPLVYLPIIMLNLYKMLAVLQIKCCCDIPSERECNPKLSGRLTFDLLTRNSTCGSLLSSTVRIWSNNNVTSKDFELKLLVSLWVIITLTFELVTCTCISKCAFLWRWSANPNISYWKQNNGRIIL